MPATPNDEMNETFQSIRDMIRQELQSNDNPPEEEWPEDDPGDPLILTEEMLVTSEVSEKPQQAVNAVPVKAEETGNIEESAVLNEEPLRATKPKRAAPDSAVNLRSSDQQAEASLAEVSDIATGSVDNKEAPTTLPLAEHKESSGRHGAYLDEENLQNLVNETVRKELQGKFGDQITRNIRTMIRIEIQQLMNAKEHENSS